MKPGSAPQTPEQRGYYRGYYWPPPLGVAVIMSIALVWAVFLGLYDPVFSASRSPREILLLSHLPIPVAIHDARGMDECTGLFCMDPSAWAIGTLDSTGCRTVLEAAQVTGYKPFEQPPYAIGDSTGGYYTDVPMPRDNASRPEAKRDRGPVRGYYLGHSSRQTGRLHEDFTWVDADSCRVFFMFSSGG